MSEKKDVILVTGAAGFIGHHLSKLLLKTGYKVVGIDNINDYYDVNLKYARLKDMNINKEDIHYNKPVEGDITFIKLDLTDKENMMDLFKTYRFDYVMNLAAQAGVRYSLINPHSYVDSNITGFLKYFGRLQALSGKTFGLCFFKFSLWIKSKYSV